MLSEGKVRMYGICVLLCWTSMFHSNVYSEWSSTAGTIRSIFSHNGSVLIDTEITDGPCSEGKFWWPITDDDSDVMLSLALTALSAQKRIKVVYSSTAPECLYNRAKITHMQLLVN